MGLEAPLALLGLLAAALPFIAHRIRRRDLTPVPLPTFALLISAEAKKRRSRGITDLILLALRTGMVVLAIMALAAPFVSARLQFGDGNVASVAIVIDDSMSMQRTRGASTAFSRARKLALDAVASLPRGSEVALVLSGAPPRVLQARTSDLALATLALDGLTEAAARGDALASAIALAGAQLGGAVHPRRRVLVISDFAAHTQLTEEALRLPNAEVSLRRIDDAEDPVNLYVSSARAVPDPQSLNTSSVAIEIGASGPASVLDELGAVRVRVRAQDKELARAEVTLSERRGRTTLRVPTPALSADPTASVQIEYEDALPIDDSAGLLLRKTDALHVMLVNGDPHPASREDELFYALPALRLAPPEVAAFSLRAIDAGALAKHDLTQTDVIVLANVAPPSAEWVERIAQFVMQGGGLVIAPGDQISPRAYQQTLATLLPCAMRARVGTPAVGLRAEAGKADWLGSGPNGLSQVKTKTRLSLECREGVALRFDDGSPALALGRLGRGQTALLALPLDADWSDLPLRPGYLALLSRVLRHVASSVAPPAGRIIAGQSVRIPVPPTAQRMEVVLPDGTRERFDALDQKSEIVLESTWQPGPYRALAAGAGGPIGDASRGAFVVEAPLAESDLTPLPSLPQLERIAGRGGDGATVRRSLSPILLLGLALFALVEGVLRLPALRKRSAR